MIDIISLNGELDAADVPWLTSQMNARLEDGHRDVAVDLGAVTLLDSDVLTVLVTTGRRSRQLGRRLWLLNPNPFVRRTFALADCADLLTEVLPPVPA